MAGKLTHDKKYKVHDPQYAIQLNGLHIGESIMLIHKYKYAGEMRAKRKGPYSIHAIQYTGNKPQLFLRPIKKDGALGYSTSHTLEYDAMYELLEEIK